MRNLVLILLALLAVPAFAVPVIKLAPGGTNEILVYVDANDVNLASGIGLTVTATGGNITAVTPAKTGVSTAASKGYGIFPGQIVFNEANEVSDYNTPAASGLGTLEVALEFGALYKHTVPYPGVDPNAPDPCSLLCTITVDSGVTEITVVGDATSCGTTDGVTAAGIITEDLDAYEVNASITLETDCFPSGFTTYNDWVTLGKPDCWCAAYQCDGDADGATEGALKYRVYQADLTLLIANWKKKIADVTLNPCADFDHKPEGALRYRVYQADLTKLISNWKKKDTALAGDCPRTE